MNLTERRETTGWSPSEEARDYDDLTDAELLAEWAFDMGVWDPALIRERLA